MTAVDQVFDERDRRRIAELEKQVAELRQANQTLVEIIVKQARPVDRGWPPFEPEAPRYPGLPLHEPYIRYVGPHTDQIWLNGTTSIPHKGTIS